MHAAHSGNSLSVMWVECQLCQSLFSKSVPIKHLAHQLGFAKDKKKSFFKSRCFHKLLMWYSSKTKCLIMLYGNTANDVMCLFALGCSFFKSRHSECYRTSTRYPLSIRCVQNAYCLWKKKKKMEKEAFYCKICVLSDRALRLHIFSDSKTLLKHSTFLLFSVSYISTLLKTNQVYIRCRTVCPKA